MSALSFPILCRAWGESDLPCVRLARSAADIRAFLISEWFGEDSEEVDEIMVQINDPDEWDGDQTDMVSWEFEIGGVSLERVFASGALIDVESAARELVKEAAAAGVVLTIEQRSLQPPAMGNYETVVAVRPVRERAAC